MKIKYKKLKNVLLPFVITIILCSNIFASGEMFVGASTGFASYLEEDESSNDAIKEVCKKFINTYITAEMGDFEKEMAILKYLTSTVAYDEDEANYDDIYVPRSLISDSYMAYGALVNHKAVCSGFAKAFEILARSCDLKSIIVTGTGINSRGENCLHAWNQICLDGEWYNIDVTWETPIRNQFINVCDMEFSKTHIRNSGEICTATKYGKNVVAYYLATGITDTNINLDDFRRAIIKQYEEISLNTNDFILNDNPLEIVGAKFDDNSNYFPSNEDLQINNYIKSHFCNGERLIIFTTPKGLGRNLSIDSGNWLNDNIDMNAHIRMQVLYETGLEYDTRILLFNIREPLISGILQNSFCEKSNY